MFDLTETVAQNRTDNKNAPCQGHRANGFAADDGSKNRIEDWLDA